jgi:hypothetical protein
MTISVFLSGKTYGGYEEDDGSISVDYKEYGYSNLYSYCGCWDEGEEIDFEGNPDFLKKLKEILLGKACPLNLSDIVLKGETIATLHIKQIVDDWELISFEKTPWENEIKALKQDYSRKIIKEKIKKGELGVDVEFSFSNSRQRWGHMSVSAPVARWLGEQLILASQGDLQFKGSEIKVENDSIAVDKKSPKKKKKSK